jgi:hypothetical protein
MVRRRTRRPDRKGSAGRKARKQAREKGTDGRPHAHVGVPVVILLSRQFPVFNLSTDDWSSFSGDFVNLICPFAGVRDSAFLRHQSPQISEFRALVHGDDNSALRCPATSRPASPGVHNPDKPPAGCLARCEMFPTHPRPTSRSNDRLRIPWRGHSTQVWRGSA